MHIHMHIHTTYLQIWVVCLLMLFDDRSHLSNNVLLVLLGIGGRAHCCIHTQQRQLLCLNRCDDPFPE